VAKVKPAVDPAPPCSPTQAQHDAAIAQLRSAYEDHLNDTMALLHNRFVGYIAESRLPIPQVLLVLKMLVSETIEQAKRKYGV
jgi:hypothetical protein